MFDINALSAAAGGNDQTKAEASKAKLDEDLNKFLNLLVTQLKNQDPLDPMDATEFTSQLVQFASVEQQIYQNSNLEKLLLTAQVSQVSNLSGFLGTMVEGTSDTFNLDNSEATFTYDLQAPATSNTITIADDSGKNVFTTGGEFDAGKHTYTWDGLDDLGNQLPDGAYTVTVSALDSAGTPIPVKQTVFGLVTSAGADQGQVTLFMGDVTLGLGSVLSVSEAPPPPPAVP